MEYNINLINGKYVIHFLAIESPQHDKYGINSVNIAYDVAIAKAKYFGGRKFHNKRFGGGIAFDSEQEAIDCINACS